VTKRCPHRGGRLAGIKMCECFGDKMVRRPYVVWSVPPLGCWAVGREIRPGLLHVVAHAESKQLAALLAERLSDGLRFPTKPPSQTDMMALGIPG
jgi:hypothetical protein